MAVINGNLVTPILGAEEREFVGDQYTRIRLLQHTSKHYHYTIDRLLMVCPDLASLLSHFKEIGNERLVKYVKGRIVGMVLIRFTMYFFAPQQYAHRFDLMFFAQWTAIRNWLQRMVKTAILAYGFPNKYYNFEIKKANLLKMSHYFARELGDVAEKKMLPHYKRLIEKKSK